MAAIFQNYTPKKTFQALVLLFLLMFICRLAYGFFYPETAVKSSEELFFDSQNFTALRKNYASEKIKQTPSAQPQPGLGQSQKYEKTANIRTQSDRFEEDDAKLKASIKRFDAVIQYEQNEGNTGHRALHLLIGVKPERFDSFYLEAQRVGVVLSKSITKTDKTNEYLQLNAQRISLEKTRNALLELKGHGGRIDEFIGLENRILEIEAELQNLGVQLGDYDETNEFCSVRFSMFEERSSKISFVQRVMVALEWSLKYWCFLTLGLLFASVASLVTLKIAESIGGSSRNTH